MTSTGATFSNTDDCTNSATLTEWSCSNGAPVSQAITCNSGNGAFCSNGACVTADPIAGNATSCNSDGVCEIDGVSFFPRIFNDHGVISVVPRAIINGSGGTFQIGLYDNLLIANPSGTSTMNIRLTGNQLDLGNNFKAYYMPVKGDPLNIASNVQVGAGKDYLYALQNGNIPISGEGATNLLQLAYDGKLIFQGTGQGDVVFRTGSPGAPNFVENIILGKNGEFYVKSLTEKPAGSISYVCVDSTGRLFKSVSPCA